MKGKGKWARVEITSAQMAHEVGAYALTQCAQEPPREAALRLQRCEHRQKNGSRYALTFGVGTFTFVDQGIVFRFTRRQIGPPVSTSMAADTNAQLYERVTIGAESHDAVLRLCARATEFASRNAEDAFQTFVWEANQEFWRCASIGSPRSIESVVIPSKTRDDILDDLREFEKEETRQWYKSHGIPYRRGLLLHGPPGCGKTSWIAALACAMRRMVHRVSLVAPRLSDDSLLLAMAEAKPSAMLVFEDVDALFDRQRRKQEDCLLTFSGLLNAIDGVGGATHGAVLIFTSNHPERLDRALCRKGRIDRTFEFGPVSDEVSRLMFARFYPGATDEEKGAFAQSVNETVPRPTPAELQHHFITMRTSPSSVAKTYQSDAPPPSDEVAHMWS